jgi:hypothetical protein
MVFGILNMFFVNSCIFLVMMIGRVDLNCDMFLFIFVISSPVCKS